MIEDKVSLEMWERLIDETNPHSQGIYTSVEDFPDEELFAFVTKLSEITGQPMADLIESFGHYLFAFLNQKYPMFSQQQTDFFEFLKSIDAVIHKEVKKLYDNALLPEIECEVQSATHLVMKYRSSRQLCLLAEGLIRGAANHYKVQYTLAHQTCQHRGDPHCTFEIHLQA